MPRANNDLHSAPRVFNLEHTVPTVHSVQYTVVDMIHVQYIVNCTCIVYVDCLMYKMGAYT